MCPEESHRSGGRRSRAAVTGQWCVAVLAGDVFVFK